MKPDISDGLSATLFQIPQIESERFDDASLTFLTESETFITMNQAAADLLELLLATFGHGTFERADLIDLLLDRFDLDPTMAESEADQILATWSAWNVIQQRNKALSQSEST